MSRYPREDYKTFLLGKKFDKIVVTEFLGKINGSSGFSYYWKMKCDCGNEKSVVQSVLLKNRIKSCGCARYVKKRNPESIRVKLIGRVFNTYKAMAKKRDYDFKISQNKFIELIFSNCFYCGSKGINKASNYAFQKDHLIYNGIDRLDNSKGYFDDNIVSCCHACNYAKNKMSVVQFKEHITKIYKNWIKND